MPPIVLSVQRTPGGALSDALRGGHRAPMPSKIQIISAAATRTGSNPIAALTDTTKVAQIASENYEIVVGNELSLYPWKHATKQAQISRRDPDVHGDPPEPWVAAYDLPADFVAVRVVKTAGTVIDWETHGNVLLTDSAESDVLLLHYIWRVPEERWPSWFTEGIIRRLEAMFLRGVGERYGEADTRDDAADRQFQRANNRDSQSQTPRDPMPSPTLAARMGSTTQSNAAIRRSAG